MIIKEDKIMTQTEKLIIQSISAELLDEISSLYSEGDGEKGTPFGTVSLPKELYKYGYRITRIYDLLLDLRVELDK